MKTWIDNKGRHRESANENHQFLSHIPLTGLDPWLSYDSWDAELAIRLITIGYNLDIEGYWESAKDFSDTSSGKDRAYAFVDVYSRGMSIAKSSVTAGLPKIQIHQQIGWHGRNAKDMTPTIYPPVSPLPN